MKKITDPFKRVKYILILFNFLICSLTYAQNPTGKSGIIPAPVSLKSYDGQFPLSNKTIIRTDSVSNKSVRFLLDHLSNNYHLHNALTNNRRNLNHTGSTFIDIICAANPDLPEEGYRLKITPKKITLTGKGAGLFYGVQTLLQLLSDGTNGHYTVPCMDIKDYPRFKYRGLMLDVSRHFFSVEEVKQLIDLMAYYKLNTFHWHLVDIEGWRIEIKKYPKLTSVGGFNVNTVLDGDRDQLDSVSTGGFYTQQQIREVVRYAQDRFITIVPEIEMPAHSAAALRAYPELKCALPENSANLIANNYIYCPSEQTFNFLEDVLTEVISLFPGKYIHIGGDEANKKPWEESPFCQQLMKELHIKDVHELQSYFIKRIEKFLNAKNRDIIGWDEISEGGLAQNATVMVRRGEKAEIAIIKQKHKVIITPGIDGLYFDYSQSNSGFEPISHGTYATTLLNTYSIDPAPPLLTEDEKKFVIGVQGSLWTEHIPTMNKLYYMIIPRIFALSEIAWTPPENKNAKTFFEISVPKNLYYLEKKGYNFRVPTAFNATDTVMIGSKFTLQNQSTMLHSKTYYTLNGHVPTECDREYTKSLEFLIPKSERRELKTIVISATGKRSVPTRTVMFNYDLFPPVSISGLKTGIIYRTYPLDPEDTDQVQLITSIGVLNDFHIDSLRNALKKFKIVYEGYINVQADNIYTFFLSAKNNNKLFIDGHSIIDDNGNFSRIENMGAAPLQKGYHKFKLEYTTEGNLTNIPIYFQTIGGERRTIPPDLLFH